MWIMDTSVLLKNSIIISIELHASCLLLTLLLFFNMRNSFIRNGRRKERALNATYIGIFCLLISDCIWTVLSNFGTANSFLAYVINLVYFIGSATAAVGWFAFSTKELNTWFFKTRYYKEITLIPYILVCILYLLSPWNGLVFSIQDGAYIRGGLFFVDPLIKFGYIGFATVFALAQGCKKDKGYLRKKDFDFALFSVPVIICGVFQTITGVDFNCLGATCGLILVYIVGITNQDNENTSAIYSLANSFEASYIVNMDTGRIRPLHEDKMHDLTMPGMKSTDYTGHFHRVLENILLPEDRDSTLDAYDINNIVKRFEIDNSFSIRYRVKEKSGQTALHTASFIKAVGAEGQNEFLLGVNSIKADSLLYERNEALSHEKQKLEEINLSIIESVAKIVEARDSGSGGHIVRVKKLTEVLARAIMEDYPESKLDREKVKLISSASVLHDVGKIVIPDSILLKPGRLTEEEFETMKTHSAKGCDVLNMFPLGLDDAFLDYALCICRWHHEKYDGKGYPDGLKGEDIPVAAQIVAAADCIDALVSERPYKKAYAPEKAIEMILNGECGAFAPMVTGTIQKNKSKLLALLRLYI